MTVRCSLADFLGSLVTHAITSPRRGRCTIRFQLGMWICLHPSMPTPFNALFRQRAVVSLLRPRVRRTVSDGILTVSAIGLGASLNLRTRLTLNRLTLFRKPWSFGERESHPLYRYLYLHLLFPTLQNASRHAFDADGNAPLPILMDSTASVTGFIPDYYPCPAPRLVSCYALFE